MKACEECRRCFDDSEVHCTEESHPALSQIRNGSPEIISGYRFDLFLGLDIKGETFYAHNSAGGSCLITIRSADEEYSHKFLTEAEIAAAFCHPNVVDVYEAGRLETGEVFLVSEDVDGRTLCQLLQAESVPKILTSVQVVRQTAEALYALHASGLTHGSINPENIILTIDAQNRQLVRIKDLDLGGVVTRSIISNKFHIDSALESLKYFAPEQCAGRGTGSKGDIYSLGVVLHEMLAGGPPFNASKAVGLIDQHRNQPPPEVKIDDIDLRMLLTHTLTEALRKQPEMRQASANAFARQMRHMEQLATHSSVPPPALTVPPIPPKHELDINGLARPVTSRSADIRLAAVVQTPKPVREENAQRPAIILEPDTFSVIADEIEPACILTENAVEDLPQILPHSAEESVLESDKVQSETVAPKRPRRSRLRSLKSRLRLGAPPLPEISEGRVDDGSQIVDHSSGKASTRIQLEMATPKTSRRSRLRSLKRKLRLGTSRSSEISGSGVDELSGTLNRSNDEPVVQTAAAMVASKEPRRSRLRELKRKLRSMAPNMLQAQLVEAPPIEETPLPPEASAMEARAVETVKTAAAQVNSARTPKVIKWEQPEDDIPSKADVVEVLSQQPVTVPLPDPEPRQFAYTPTYSRSISIDLEPAEVPVRFLPEDLLPNRPQKVVFLPSLGISAIRETLDDQSGPIFSSFYGQPGARRRWKMVGGGIVMLAALFFAGRIATRDFVQDDLASRPAVTTAVETSPPRIERPVDLSPISPIPVKNVKSSPPKEPGVITSNPLPAKDIQVPSTERTRKPVGDAGLKRAAPYAGLIGRNLGTMQPPMSTVVITYGNGKVTSRTQPGRSSVDKKPVAAPKRTMDPARPRVVKVPN